MESTEIDILQILEWGIDLLIAMLSEVGVPTITFIVGLAVPFLMKMVSNYRENKILYEHYLDTLRSILPEIEGKITGLENMTVELNRLTGLQPPPLRYYPSTHTILNSFDAQKVYGLFSHLTKQEGNKSSLEVIRIQKALIFLSEFDSLVTVKYKEMTEAIQTVNQEWNLARQDFHNIKAQLIVAGVDIGRDPLLLGINARYNQWGREPNSLDINLKFFNELHEFIYPFYSKSGRNDLLPLISACQEFNTINLQFQSIQREYNSAFASMLGALKQSLDDLKKNFEILKVSKLKPWFRMPFS